MKKQPGSILAMTMLALAAGACGGEPDPVPTGPVPDPKVMGCGASCDAGTMTPGPTGKVTRCLGPSCPRGECGFSGDCSAYSGLDALDSSQLCGAATGSKEFCLQYEVPGEDGYVDIEEQVVSCALPTVVKRSCSAGCGYNYAPDDCGVCNDRSGCVFN